MIEIPSEVLQRRDEYCRSRSRDIQDLRGYGVDAFIWQATNDHILKVFRRPRGFDRERDIYLRLQQRSLYRLQGFWIPILVDYDDAELVLEMTFVRPPYILDFAACGLDQCPPGFDPYDPHWIAEQSRKFGRDWPDVQRLLDALRQYGISLHRRPYAEYSRAGVNSGGRSRISDPTLGMQRSDRRTTPGGTLP